MRVQESTLLTAAGRTDAGRVRTNNEDAFVVADLSRGAVATDAQLSGRVGPLGALLAVSDGVGGALAGEVASTLVLASLRAHLTSAGQGADIQRSIKAAVERANRDVWQAASESGHEGMGATLTAVLLRDGRAYVASVGGTRAYVVRGGAITREEAEHSPYRNVILQAMGVKPDVEAAIVRIPLRRGDVYLLCSDGLWETVSDEEMAEIVGEAGDVRAACERLVELAKERKSSGNITAVVAGLTGAGLPEPGAGELVAESVESIQEFRP